MPTTITGRRNALRSAAAAAAVVLAMTGGCASQESDNVTRTGTRELNSDGTTDGYIGGNSLTQIPPDQRKAAPVASGLSLDGKTTVSSGGYPGKVVVINVWGSWCAPCRAEAPDLNEASVETAEIAAFVGINIRDNQLAAAQAFVRAFKVPYPSIYDPNGQQLLLFAGILPRTESPPPSSSTPKAGSPPASSASCPRPPWCS